MTRIKEIVLFFFTMISPLSSYADHIFGGYIGFKTIDVSSKKYLLTLNVYVDLPKRPVAIVDFQQYNPKINIFRKRDNQLMDKFLVTYKAHNEVIFKNNACAVQKKFEILHIYLDYEINIDPTQYSDPGGYYMVYDQCCRNKDVDNIIDPGSTGTLFYTEIPALISNGQLVNYSTPEYEILNGEYICVNKPFKYQFSATDTDGDQLKYSLGVPLVGVSKPGDPAADPISGPYNSVNWASGYNNAVPITGNPSLSIDNVSGEVSLKANKEGLFVFSITCEDYRDGKKMGLVKHDFQLPVVACSFNTPPFSSVLYNGVVESEIGFCPGSSFELKTTDNPNWSFQWQKDGYNIPNANSNNYIATEKASYQVIKSFKNVCSNDTLSNVVTLKPAVSKPDISANSRNICGSNSIILKAGSPNSSFKYYWLFNNAQFATGDSVTVSNAGWYYLQADKTIGGCLSEIDSVEVTKTLTTPLPEPKSLYEACFGEQIEIETLLGTGYSYQWQRDAIPIVNETKNKLNVTQEGIYSVLVSDQNNCKGTSKNYVVKYTSQPTIVFPSLDPMCLAPENVGILFAQPTGGKFSGKGVFENRFDPEKAGLGSHEIVYEYSSPTGCKGIGKINAEVKEPFTLDASPDISQLELGDSVFVKISASDPSISVHWHPDDFLIDHNAMDQLIKPTESVTYTVVGISDNGCKVKKDINIILSGYSKLFIPDAITPNGDGFNDYLEIFGDKLSDFNLSIFDRWGSKVFETTVQDNFWNGTRNNMKTEPLESGIYPYNITGSNSRGFKINSNGTIILLK